MTARALAVVALRVWGIILLGWTWATVPMTVFNATLAARGTFANNPESLARLAAHLLAAVALIVLADPVARRAIPSGSSGDAGIGAAQLGTLALTLVGIFLLLDGVQTIAAAGYALATRPRGPLRLNVFPPPERLWEAQREQIARTIPLIAASAAIFWRDRLARALAAVRRPPTPTRT